MLRPARISAYMLSAALALLLNLSWVAIALADADDDGYTAAHLVALPPALATMALALGVVYWRSRIARTRRD